MLTSRVSVHLVLELSRAAAWTATRLCLQAVLRAADQESCDVHERFPCPSHLHASESQQFLCGRRISSIL